MQDLTGAVERRTTLMLALLVSAILLLPVVPSGAQVDRPGQPQPAPTVVPTPTPTPEPTEDPALGGIVDELDDQIGDDEDQAESPASETPSEAPAAEDEGPSEVQAEGNDAQEVIAAPEAPEPADRGEAAAPADGEVAAEGEVPVEGEVPAEDAIAPPPIETYGVNVVPSLGTAARPLTNPYSGDPMVLAPMVAGQPVKGADPVPVDKSALLQVVEPARNVAAASLSVVQPSWYATTLALLVLLAAATYGAVLRRRGEDVPEAIAFTGAVRPRNAHAGAGRSVRPVDLQRSVRSVRP